MTPMRRITAVPIVSLLAFLATGVAGVSRAAALPAPTGTFPTPELSLSRMGVFPPGFTQEATKRQFVDLLGWADRVTEHPADGACLDWEGKPSGSRPEMARTVRWGDLTVTFDHDNIMRGYIYGPRAFARPSADYEGHRIGDTLAGLLSNPAVVVGQEYPPYGHLVRVRGQAPGLQGFATGPTATDRLTMIWVGTATACFGTRE